MKSIKVYVQLVFVTLLLFSCSTVKMPSYVDGVILVTAHRATHDSAPENSLTAIRHSIRDKIDIVEIDVKRTQDNQLVLMHDRTVDRTTTGSGEVEELVCGEVNVCYLLCDGMNNMEISA